ncbi:MAG: hypothetical protein O7I42_13555, partial [Alphaproteobacteria bacterium]|nr:hypothetical protein [Alphaproteobacteria bacterium]
MDERWSKIYATGENFYRGKRNLTAAAVLTAPQREEAAGVANLLRDVVIDKIRTQANKYRTTAARNARHLLRANESITKLLVSSREVISARAAVVEKAGELVPILPVVKGFVE